MSLGWVLLAVSVVAVALAFVLGGIEERVFAIAQALSVAADNAIGAAFTADNVGGEMAIDLVLLAVVLRIALRTSKLWPFVAASLCVVATETQAAHFFISIDDRIYVFTQGLWEFLSCAVVSVGAFHVWRSARDLAPGGA